MAWRGAVRGAGVIEVGQDVLAAAGQGLSQSRDVFQSVGDGLPQGSDEPLHQPFSQVWVFGAHGLDEALVDAQEAWTAAWRSSAKRFSRRSAWGSVSRPVPVSSVRRVR